MTNAVFHPKVSIIIPVFNGSDFLADAIESALAQTYDNCEIIVINDGSNDDSQTESIALGYENRIQYFSKENGGVASALNLALQHVSGDYVSWLSHDDIYEPDKIIKQIEFLSSINDPKTIVYSDYSVFTNNNNQTRITLGYRHSSKFRFWITTENRLHGCTLLIPTLAFKDIGTFDVTLKTTQDYDLWFRMSEHYNFVYLPLSLVKSRQHEKQGSRTMASLALQECNQLYINFLSKLNHKDLHAYGFRSIHHAYASISISMTARGFDEASKFAKKKALKGLWHTSFWTIAIVFMSLGYDTLNAKLVYYIRQKIIRNIRHFIR